MLDADTVHTGRPASSAGYQYRVLYLDAAGLRPLLTGGADLPARLSFRETILREPAMAGLLDRTHAALADDNSPMAAETLLLRLSLLLATRYGAAPADPRTRGHARGVAAARDYLEAHPTDKVSLRDLAGVALTSPYDLVRTFSVEFGMPPHAYQIQLRVRHARRLLAVGTPVAKVARQSGFYDQAHLSRVFKRYTGVTPRQFALGAGACRAGLWVAETDYGIHQAGSRGAVPAGGTDRRRRLG